MSWRTRRVLARDETRAVVRRRMRELYDEGSSIRRIATLFNLSFGTVRNLLVESDVALRGRGGVNRRRTT